MQRRSTLTGFCALGLCALALTLCVQGPAAATPPPVSPEQFRYWDAMRALEPFVGTWTGAYDLYPKVQVSRVVTGGPNGELYLALDEGSFKPARPNDIRLIQFDPGAGVYVLLRFGYGRPLTTPMRHPDAETLQWDDPIGDGRTYRTTLTVRDGTWREVVAHIGPDGAVTQISAITLKRVESK
jgi:hypothetical protein